MWRDVVSGLLQQNLCTAMLNVLQIKQTEIHIKIFFLMIIANEFWSTVTRRVQIPIETSLNYEVKQQVT